MTQKSLHLHNVHLDCSSKKACLEAIAESAATQADLNENQAWRALSERERMGSTGLGNGLAIPHARLATLDHAVIIWTTLSHPVAFDALDDQPVDVLISLLVPEAETQMHLKTLSRLAGVFQDPQAIEKFRNCPNERTMIELIDDFGLSDL